MKKLTCRDIGVDCEVEFHGETDDEIMSQASEHAKQEHNLPVIPPHIEEKCRKAIVDDAGAGQAAQSEDDKDENKSDDKDD